MKITSVYKNDEYLIFHWMIDNRAGCDIMHLEDWDCSLSYNGSKIAWSLLRRLKVIQQESYAESTGNKYLISKFVLPEGFDKITKTLI